MGVKNAGLFTFDDRKGRRGVKGQTNTCTTISAWTVVYEFSCSQQLVAAAHTSLKVDTSGAEVALSTAGTSRGSRKRERERVRRGRSLQRTKLIRPNRGCRRRHPSESVVCNSCGDDDGGGGRAGVTATKPTLPRSSLISRAVVWLVEIASRPVADGWRRLDTCAPL